MHLIKRYQTRYAKILERNVVCMILVNNAKLLSEVLHHGGHRMLTSPTQHVPWHPGLVLAHARAQFLKYKLRA